MGRRSDPTTKSSNNRRGLQPEAGMATVSPAKVVIPHSLQEKTAELKKQEKKVKKLQKLLRSAELKYHQLKDELSSYQCTLAPSLINNLPEEVLLMIFTESISHNRKRVRRLLLVCKRWYGLVLHHPQMWNVISLEVPEDEWDMCHWASSVRPFVTQCLERSRSTPLHITLDLENLQHWQEQLADRVAMGFSDFAYSEGLHRWIGNLDYGDLEGEPMIEDCLPEHVLELLGTLLRGGMRWHTLQVFFPTTASLFWRVWFILNHPLPNLCRASLHNLDDWNLPKGRLFSTNSDFSKVKYLTLNGICNWDLVAFFPSSLEELVMDAYSNQLLPSDLSRFTQLRILSIDNWMFDSTETAGPVRPVQIALPCLQELSLHGRFEQLDRIEFKLPILKHLTLGWRLEDVLERDLPVMQPLQVNWLPAGKQHIQDLARVALRRILEHFTGSATLSVPISEREILSQVLGELSGEKALSSAWKSIAFHEDDEIVENRNIHDLIGIP